MVVEINLSCKSVKGRIKGDYSLVVEGKLTDFEVLSIFPDQTAGGSISKKNSQRLLQEVANRLAQGYNTRGGVNGRIGDFSFFTPNINIVVNCNTVKITANQVEPLKTNFFYGPFTLNLINNSIQSEWCNVPFYLNGVEIN